MRCFALGLGVLVALASFANAQENWPFKGAGSTNVAALQAPAPPEPTSTVPAPQTPPPLIENLCCGSQIPCEPCQACGGQFVAGAGFYYVQPSWETDPAFQVNDLGLFLRTDDSLDLSITYDYEFAPRVWFGYADPCGLGFRARWWHFDQSTTDSVGNAFDGNFLSDELTATITQQVAVESDLELSVWDLEATAEYRLGCWSFLLAGGLRYARLSQNYRGTEVASFSTFDSDTQATAEFDLASSVGLSDRFWGLGPTVALETRYAIGCTGVSLYGGARLSVLVGRGEQEFNQAALFRLEANDPTDPPPTSVQFSQSSAFTVGRDDVLPIGEIELGLEWNACYCGSQYFVQAALVGQSWFDAVIPSTGGESGDRASLLDFSSLSFDGGKDNDNQLNFFGITFVAGVRF
jgi:hypothetical protein